MGKCMIIQDLIDKLNKSTDKTAKVSLEIDTIKNYDIIGIQYYLNGEVLLETGPVKRKKKLRKPDWEKV